jgi:hypothetical protein
VNNYKLVTLPVSEDAFLKELDMFVQSQVNVQPFANKKEYFHDYQLDYNYLDEINKMDSMPDHLQQKIILNAFFERVVLTGSLVPYGLVMGAYNLAIHDKTTVIRPS